MFINSSEKKEGRYIQKSDISSPTLNFNDSVKHSLSDLFEHAVPNVKFLPEESPRDESIISNWSKNKIHEDLSLRSVSELHQWKQKDSYSARITEIYDKVVVLELVIDRDERITEEREFEIKYFEGLKIEIGNLFKVKRFERPNSQMIQVCDGNGIVNREDFPKVDFSQFKNKSLFK